jgi:hypothetical protein
MAFEKKLQKVLPLAFTADGTEFGVITVSDTAGFRVKQIVAISSDTPQSEKALQVKDVISDTQLIVGLNDNKLGPQAYTDVSTYTVVLNSKISAAVQDKPGIPPDPHYFAVYEGDPVVADRVVNVDKYGRMLDTVIGPDGKVRLATDATVTIETLQVRLDALTPPTQPAPDNVLIAGSEDGTKGGLKHAARVDSDLDLRVGVSDGNNKLKVNPDGTINVNVVPSTNPDNIVKNTFGTASAVVGGVTTNIVTYTVPIGKTAILQRSVASGENIGTFTLSVNSNVESVLRTYYAGPFNVTFEFITGQENGLLLNSGDVVTVTILHNRPFTGNFDGRIQVFEITP